jgi:hypothetical protein
VYQRASRYIGPSTPRMPLAAIRSIHLSCATERSTSVVTPDISASHSATRKAAFTPSASGRKIGMIS